VIRLTLRQFRTEAVVGFGLLTVLAIVLVITGVHLAQMNDAFEATCKATGNCASAANPVFEFDQGLQALVPIIAIVTPAVVGLFFGAPLIARELETGTFRLAWTQSVTCRRWLAVKLGLVGLVAVAIGGLLTWTVDWWESPLDAASQNRFDPVNFGFHGVVPIGYAAFAFALGVTAGVLLRRTFAAMGATLVGFVVARLAVTSWVRPNLAAPLHESFSFLTARPVIGLQSPANTLSLIPPLMNIPNGWVYSTAVVDKSGYTPTGQYLLHACPALGQILNAGPAAGPPVAIHTCINKLSATFHTVATYQPASRFWPFQWAELGIFLAAALVLCGLTYWWLRRQSA
jgi:ABC-2 family transporter protein